MYHKERVFRLQTWCPSVQNHWSPLVARQYQQYKHLNRDFTIMNLSELTNEVYPENITNVNVTLESEITSKKLMFLIEGVCLGIVATLGITGKYSFQLLESALSICPFVCHTSLKALYCKPIKSSLLRSTFHICHIIFSRDSDLRNSSVSPLVSLSVSHQYV